MGEFHFRNLRVYRLSLQLFAFLYRETRSAPRDARPIVTQLLRASSSIVLNIAEGAGEYRALEKARFYRMARRSSWETSAAVDILHVIGFVRKERADRAHDALNQIGAMLTTLTRNHETAATNRSAPETRAAARPVDRDCNSAPKAKSSEGLTATGSPADTAAPATAS